MADKFCEEFQDLNYEILRQAQDDATRHMENETQTTEPEIFTEELPEEPKKRKINVELILFLILGFLLGVVVKTEAGKRITVGFEDYKIAALQRGYDLNQVQKNVAEKAKAEQEQNGDASAEGGDAVGGACGN